MNVPSILTQSPLAAPTALASHANLAVSSTSLTASGLPSPYIHLSLFQSVAATIVLLLMVIILALGLHRMFRHHRQLRRARDYVEQSIARISPVYDSRPLIEALMPSYFDVPVELIGSAAEPQLSPTRLGWFLGLLDVLGPNSSLYFGDLHPKAHPSRPCNVVSPEFWLYFEYDGCNWAIWLPDRNSFEVIDRKTFGSYVSTFRRQRSCEQVMAWLKRHHINRG